VIRSRYFYSIT